MSTNPYAIRVEYLDVNGNKVATDQEGYIQNMDEWSEAFAVALAKKEGLVLTKDHWEVIYYIKAYYEEHCVQAQVRDMIKYFKNVWGPDERGNNRYLHDIFPKGGPQKQGNRLAGIRRTKGEH
ncbi:MAG: TusE/DsrC/DsvC family sulfur relay protein [Candidatus Thiodiazotropha sp. (ex Lucinoma aequizonata)]|nr:TusE/DsrC/DsvC family sulfur relay protein [Candidatus Thiodiazotropha sp. (ex Lucinoma aequizonata)]MCU7886943.1 TusE/DsrC/DsvC family sulfur relay protein [Candidatus Thiodiazotropha sp. (ex Lucinoma aequizonata)]MCU7896767.1 TusE/DsrC/DsvC family sulfur relay protein [Candidatus Thiodiazotropha sp. (ex Lucinoma aequizonata)]MCU7897973.1 TusE/DsrC/DsvC family sulfur relay protein [Candidatus Thiodiazotropha sp. (ex Lucinoma aequizonata)]MCU7903700.1 TusE/DsrC/DsvC family sulfur relay prote